MTPQWPKVKDCRTCGTLGSLTVALQDMYRRFPEWSDCEAWEAQHALWSLGYVDDLLPEEEIEAAMLVVRAVRAVRGRKGPRSWLTVGNNAACLRHS